MKLQIENRDIYCFRVAETGCSIESIYLHISFPSLWTWLSRLWPWPWSGKCDWCRQVVGTGRHCYYNFTIQSFIIGTVVTSGVSVSYLDQFGKCESENCGVRY